MVEGTGFAGLDGAARLGIRGTLLGFSTQQAGFGMLCP